MTTRKRIIVFLTVGTVTGTGYFIASQHGSREAMFLIAIIVSALLACAEAFFTQDQR